MKLWFCAMIRMSRKVAGNVEKIPQNPVFTPPVEKMVSKRKKMALKAYKRAK